MSQPYSILIVDSEISADSLRDGLADAPYPIPLNVTKTGESAKSAILDRRNRLAGIILNPVVDSPGALKLISLIHLVRPATPIHLLYDRRIPFAREEMDRLAVTDAVSRIHLEDMLRERFAAEIFQPGLPGKPGEPPEPLELNEEGFFAVAATDFLSGNPTYFDIHVRLPSGRFLKIVEAKDVFQPKRVLGYMSKGVQHFYLKRESHSRCLSYCDVLAKQMLSHKQASIEVKISDAFNRGQDIIDQIQTEGFRDDQLDFVKSFLSSSRAVMSELKLDDEDAVRCLLNHVVGYQHAVGTTMVAALLTLPLKIETASGFHSVGLASLLHDVGLYQLPENLRHEDQSRMTPEERDLYRQHPQLGANFLAQTKRLDATVIQAIAQHHERRDNQGFPGIAHPSEINRVAEIIGISDAFVNLLVEARNKPEMDALQEMESRVFPGYSYPIIEGFRAVFMKNRPPR